MIRWALLLSAYSYEIHYIPGPNNNIADALSRLPQQNCGANPCDIPNEFVNLLQHLDSTPTSSDLIRRDTDRDPTLSKIKRMLLQGWPATTPSDLKPFTMCRSELSLHEGCILRGSRIVVPPSHRGKILQELHDAHPGIVRMKAKARSYCWWPGIDGEIESLIRSCSECQHYQRNRTPGPIYPWEIPDGPWERLHADYFGPIEGKMCLLIVDAYTKWIEVHIVANATAEATVNKLRQSLSVYGLPKTVCTDNGPQFTSAVFKEFLCSNGIDHITFAPYHPSSNGLAERAVQTVKAGLMKQRPSPLQIKLERFLFAYRTTPLESINKTPGEALFGRRLRTRLDLLFPDRRNVMRSKQLKMHQRGSPPIQTPEVASEVFTKLPHQATWQSGVVIQTSPTESTIQLADGTSTRRHNDYVRSKKQTDRPSADHHTADVSTDDQPQDIQTAFDIEPPIALHKPCRTIKPVDRFIPRP